MVANLPLKLGDTPLLETRIPSFPLWRRGKVRDVYDLGDRLLMVATDRLSAFDVVLPTGIPGKGVVLTQLSLFWFRLLGDVVGHHVLTAEVEGYGAELAPYREELEGRSMVVRKTEPLPAGLQESERLDPPIFTPATKAQTGHDENISFEVMESIIGAARAREAREASLALYRRACAHAEARGILLADTKFEFGVRDGALVWIDEALTPDSSRFWPKAGYAPGRAQPSFDKQFVRDHLDTRGWDRNPPGPELPPEVVERTRHTYLEAWQRLTGPEEGLR